MGWQDRNYAHSDYDGGPGRMMYGGFMWPRITPMVKKILIANVVVFLAQIIFQRSGFVEYIGAFVFKGALLRGQVWRFVTYQYLHAGVGHIFFNMLGLYFLGSLMEQRWGGRRFLMLYTLFGVAGAVLYSLLVAVQVFPDGRMIGASGSVLGLVGACAVAAPQVMVILIIFPVPIRVVAILFGVVYLLSVMGSENAADACHLGGLAVGALWAWLEIKGIINLPAMTGERIGPSGRKWVQVKVRKGAWERKVKRQQAQQAEIDRILRKIHEKGLGSLSRREKKRLQKASEDHKQQ